MQRFSQLCQCSFRNVLTSIVGTEQHWKERIGTSAEGRGETGEKRDGEEKTCMPIAGFPQPLHLFPSLYTSSPAFTPLYQDVTPLYQAFTPLCMSLHVHIKDCEVLLSK